MRELERDVGAYKVKRIMSVTMWNCTVCDMSHDNHNAANTCCQAEKRKRNAQKRGDKHDS